MGKAVLGMGDEQPRNRGVLTLREGCKTRSTALYGTRAENGTDSGWSAASPDNRHAVFRPNTQHVWCVDMATGEVEDLNP